MDLAKKTEKDNPVYYVQYAHARIVQTMEKARETQGQAVPAASEADLSRLTEETETDLIKKLSDFPDEVRQAAPGLRAAAHHAVRPRPGVALPHVLRRGQPQPRPARRLRRCRDHEGAPGAGQRRPDRAATTPCPCSAFPRRTGCSFSSAFGTFHQFCSPSRQCGWGKAAGDKRLRNHHETHRTLSLPALPGFVTGPARSRPRRAPPAGARRRSPPSWRRPSSRRSSRRGRIATPGDAHPWSVTPAHALQWDGTPYLPVGGTSRRSPGRRARPPTAWDADRKALDDWKAHGVLDVCLSAGSVGLDPCPAGRVSSGCSTIWTPTASVTASRSPTSPKTRWSAMSSSPAFIVTRRRRRAARRVSARSPGWPMRFICSSRGTTARSTGPGTAQVAGQDTASRQRLRTAGRTTCCCSTRSACSSTARPKVTCRISGRAMTNTGTALLSFFRRVKLGPGFRFFLDPLTDASGSVRRGAEPGADDRRLPARLPGLAGQEVPSQHGRSEPGVGDRRPVVRAAPSPTSRPPPAAFRSGMRRAASRRSTTPSKRVMYGVTNKPHIAGHYWDDLNEFRIESTRGYMNAIADALQKGRGRCAGRVPVDRPQCAVLQ